AGVADALDDDGAAVGGGGGGGCSAITITTTTTAAAHSLVENIDQVALVRREVALVGVQVLVVRQNGVRHLVEDELPVQLVGDRRLALDGQQAARPAADDRRRDRLTVRQADRLQVLQ